MCGVGPENGGGETPIAAGNGVTANGQPCPSGGALPTGPALPSWYGATGLTQGPNVQLANACTSFASGPNSCYVFTDRGTYDYLRSGTDPAGSISNLKVVTSANAASAPGGAHELINYFHAYAIKGSKPGESVNAVAATDFLNLITSPALQARIGRYLAHTGDPGGAPFVPDASPIIHGWLPRRAAEGESITIHGTVKNAELGYRAPTGLAVGLDRLVAGFPIPIASTRTSRGGAYRLSFKLRATGTYELVTPQVSQIENSSLSPPFGDILSPAATNPWRIVVAGARSRTH